MSKVKRNRIAYKDYDESKSFDSYIKKLEDGLLDNITKNNNDKRKDVQEKRDINIKLHNHSNLSQRRLDKKASELETKENQLNQALAELDLKNQKLIKELEIKNQEIMQLKDMNTQLILDKAALNHNNSIIQLKNDELESQIAQLNTKMINKPIQQQQELTPQSSSKDKDKAKPKEIMTERSVIDSNDVMKENKNLKKVIQFQKEKIKELETELKNTIINSHKEKESMYTKRIDTLEKINKELLIKVNNQQDYQQQIKDQLCLYLLKDKNDNTNNNNNGSIGVTNKKNKVFTFKNGGSNNNSIDKRDKLEKLIKEKDFLLNNGNYSNNDALILRIEDKINKILENINS